MDPIYHSGSNLAFIGIMLREIAKKLMVDTNYSRIPKMLKNLVVAQNKVIKAICLKPLFVYHTMHMYIKTNRIKNILFMIFFYNGNFPRLRKENF